MERMSMEDYEAIFEMLQKELEEERLANQH